MARWQYALIFCLSAVFPAEGWAVGGTESMDRPSSRPLPTMPAKPDKDNNALVLPPIPIDKDLLGASPKIRLDSIILDGNTVFPVQDLQALIKDYEHRDVSIAEIEELRQKLTQYYINHGYINSGAVIAEDAIKDGKLHIQLIEGRLDEVTVSGQDGLREGYIINRLQGDPDAPFNMNELQDRFQNLLSDPLISRMNGKILPGKSSGQSILDVAVTRAKPYHLALFGDNYRPPSIGGEAFGLEGWVRNLTGLGDVLDFTFINSEGSNRYAGGFSLPLTDQGTAAYFHFDEGDSKIIEGSAKEVNIQSQVHNLEGGISQLVINKLNQKLTLGIQFAIRENKTSALGVPFSFIPGVPSARNQTTVLRLFQEGLWRGDNQAVILRSTFNVGVNALGATPKTSHRFPSSEFFSWLGQGQYAYRVLDNGAQVVLRGNAQFSDSPLLPLEQIAVGGISTVRGYRENHLVRDNGYSLSLEFQYPLIADSDPEYGHQLTLIPFMDYGEAWNVFDDDQDSAQALHSVGIGFNWKFNILSTDLFYGYALNTPSPKSNGDIQDSGIHFQARLDVF
jgi:hemolysin activation/secretion protein